MHGPSKHLFLPLLIALLMISSCALFAPPPPEADRLRTIDLQACRLPIHPAELLCGQFSVYENREAANGRRITLSVLIVPALSPDAKPDPVFFLAGGPGQGAARMARSGENALMRALRRERDLVFIDQRGTGDSNRLSCAVSGDRRVLQNYFREIFEPEAVGRCRRSLERNADLRYYTTPLAVEDMEEIRRALGYKRINLYATSYGTVGALEYMRRYPEHVRSAVLAGAMTPAAKLPLHFARDAERALARLLDDCASDPSCQAAFPALRRDWANVMNSFAGGAVQLTLIHPQTGRKEPVTLTREAFAERLRSMLYDHSSARLLPLLIQSAAHGDWQPFANVAARAAAAPAYTLALGSYLTATCAESVPFIEPREAIETTAGTFLGAYRIERHRSACAHWPRAEIDAAFFKPVESPLPVLMLSGDLDPVTPADLAEAAARFLPNGRLVVLRNTPHSYNSACARSLSMHFIARGNADALDISCAAAARRPRFATELPERYRLASGAE